MSRRPLRPRPALVAATVMAAALTVGGCSAGAVTQTDTMVSTVTGAQGQAGEVLLRDITIDPGPQVTVPAGGTVALRGTLVNEGALGDRLVSVSTPYASQVRPEGQTTIPGDNATRLVGSEPGPVGPPIPNVRFTGTGRITLAGVTQVLHAGPTYAVTFTFERGGTVTVPVPVVSSAPETAPVS